LIGKNRQITQTLTTKDIPLLIGTLLSSNQHDFQQYVTLEGKTPEVVVLFLEPKLRTDEVVRHSSSLHFLQSVMENGVSSIYSPFVQMDSPLVTPLIEVASSAQKNGASILYLGKGSLLESLKSKIPSVVQTEISSLASSDIFSNGIVDLLFVELSSNLPTIQERLSETDSHIEEIHNILSAASSQYISVFTALKHHPVENDLEIVIPVHKKRDLFFIQQNNTPDGNITIPHWFNRWFPGWFWELFVVCSTVVAISLCGTLTLFSLQGLDKLAKPNKDPQRRY